MPTESLKNKYMFYVNNNIFNLETSGNIPEKIKVKYVNLRF